MSQHQVNDRVRLTCDVPERGLNRGDVGLVRSIWFAPSGAFEVEFGAQGSGEPTRALLVPRQLELLNAAKFPDSVPELVSL
jgi:hypothetical protein